jgi:Zn-dependent protease
LGLLNILPLPGFDGIKVLYLALPDSWCWRLHRAERWSLAYLALLSALGGLDWMGPALRAGLDLFSRAFGFPV